MSTQEDVIVVTGSSGLIGAALIRRLEDEGYRIFGFDRPGLPHPPPPAEAVDVDVTNEQMITAAFERVRREAGARIASVIHLAAYYDFSGEPSPLYEEVTVRGTERMLRAIKNQGFQCEQFQFASTMLVHAPCEPGQKINEEWPVEPKWDYPKSKVRTEQLIHEARGDIRAMILRVAGVYDDRGNSIPITHQIQRIYERTMTAKVFPGDTAHGQAFVHLDDVIDAIDLALRRRNELPPETVLLIGEDETISYDELQHTLGRMIHDENWETTEIPKVVAKTGAWFQDKIPGEDPFIKPWMIDLADDHYELDISRARALLGWSPRHSLRETLPEMVRFLKEDPLGFYEANKLETPSGLKERQQQGQKAVRK